MSIELPPAPATAREAMTQANQIAYGFEKHTDERYWDRYPNDPVYYWRRLLGWQAGGDDVAHFGLYANPPSEWHLAATNPEPGTTDPGTGTEDGGIDFDLVAFLARLNELEANIVKLETLLTDVKNRPWPTYTGKLLGYTITLAPKANA